MRKPKYGFYCTNGAYHSYLCCKTCANQYKKDINTDDDFRFSHKKEIEESRKYWFIESAGKAGFTKKQAEFLFNS